jgi:hypothetical protein
MHRQWPEQYPIAINKSTRKKSIYDFADAEKNESALLPGS